MKNWPFGVSVFWREIEPWDWLRHITPWWLLSIISKHYHVCWMGMVMWKQGYSWSWSLRRGCFFPFDYCGKYDDASEEERREAILSIGEQPKLYVQFEGNEK